MTDEEKVPIDAADTDARALAELVDRARAGQVDALNTLVKALVDDVYRLSLRMTANPADAQDATQEVMIKVVTNLSAFKGASSVRTWAYRITVRHLLDQRRTRVEALQLDFDSFGADLLDGLDRDASAETAEAEEVKLGCSLAMLTCLDRDQRIAYILSEVFDLPHSIAASLCDVSEEVYRQRLSRARRQVEGFTKAYCGVVNSEAPCRCDRRVKRAVELGRLQRERLVLTEHARIETAEHVREMEALHGAARLFRSHPQYAAPEHIAEQVRTLLSTKALAVL